MKKAGKIISLILSILMLVQLMPSVTFADVKPYHEINVTDTINVRAGSVYTLDNFVDYVPEEALFSLMYSSEAYKYTGQENSQDYIHMPTYYVFEAWNKEYLYVYDNPALKDVVTGDMGKATSAKLSIPIPTQLANGEWSVKIYADIAYAKGNEDVKPLQISVNLNVGDAIADEIVINELLLTDYELSFYNSYEAAAPKTEMIEFNGEQFDYLMCHALTPEGLFDSMNFEFGEKNELYPSTADLVNYSAGNGIYTYFIAMPVYDEETGTETLYTAAPVRLELKESENVEDVSIISFDWDSAVDGGVDSGAFYYEDHVNGIETLTLKYYDDQSNGFNYGGSHASKFYAAISDLLPGGSSANEYLYSVVNFKNEADSDFIYDAATIACVENEFVVKSVDTENFTVTSEDEEVFDLSEYEVWSKNGDYEANLTYINEGNVVSLGVELPTFEKNVWISDAKLSVTDADTMGDTMGSDYIVKDGVTYYCVDGSDMNFSDVEGDLSYFGTVHNPKELIADVEDDEDSSDSNEVAIEEVVTDISTEGAEVVLDPEDESFILENPGNTVTIAAKAEYADDTDDPEITSAAEEVKLFAENSVENYVLGPVLNLTVSKERINADGSSNATIPLAEVNGLVEFNVKIPDVLWGKDTYVVLRKHDVVDKLEENYEDESVERIEVDRENNTLAIYANKFSVYALAAVDADEEETDEPDSSRRRSSRGDAKNTTLSVTFNTDGGSKIDAVRVTSGKTLAFPTSPVKDGFVFGGWFTDKELTKEFDFESPVTKAVTLYAKWTEKVKKNIVLAIGSAEADINGEKVEMDASPVIVNERAMLPIRFIAETLGAKVIWEPETKTVKINLSEIEISLVVGESKATVNGEEIALDTESFIKNDRTYLPVRFVMENLGADVVWNAENNTVTIAEK